MPRLDTGEAGPVIQCLLDPERLIPFRHALGTRERTNLELKHAPANCEVDDRHVLGLARARRDDRPPIGGAGGLDRRLSLAHGSNLVLLHPYFVARWPSR